MFRNKSISSHSFAMVPRADIPRSGFPINTGHKTSFDAGWLIPIFVDEVLPGDTFNVHSTILARLATPIFPFMDNVFIDTFYFFVPNRLVWENWQRFMGEQDNPTDTIDYITPKIYFGAGVPELSIYDYYGLPTTGQVTGSDVWGINAMFFRAYNLIWKEWFRDENLQDSPIIKNDDGPDLITDYTLLKRGKRKDYFTAALPRTQKGPAVGIPLGTSAPITGIGFTTGFASAGPINNILETDNVTPQTYTAGVAGVNIGAAPGLAFEVNAAGTGPALYADLSESTQATINLWRQAFQIQRLLERDMRGGTRYTEIVRSHFGVVSPDARLQRPEYLGGGSTPISISPVAQTSGAATGAETPQGNLAAYGTVVARNGFSQSFTEHGMIIGLASVRADLTYQQGIRKMFLRATRYDYYWPAFQALGEQAVYNAEIYFQGDNTEDYEAFGYQERWAEYRYHPAMITGLMRSTATGTIDPWHLSQHFTALPTLNSDFIEENPPLERVIAVGEGAGGQQFVADIHFSGKKIRPLPMFSVPGMIDHF